MNGGQAGQDRTGRAINAPPFLRHFFFPETGKRRAFVARHKGVASAMMIAVHGRRGRIGGAGNDLVAFFRVLRPSAIHLLTIIIMLAIRQCVVLF